jgi:hypothetical protein
MQKSSLKLYFTTFIVMLSVTSFTFAGNGHCPDDPPPPADPGGRMAVQVVEVKPALASTDSQILKNIWEFVTQSIRLF